MIIMVWKTVELLRARSERLCIFDRVGMRLLGAGMAFKALETPAGAQVNPYSITSGNENTQCAKGDPAPR